MREIDMVEYCQTKFLPIFMELLSCMRTYTIEENECLVPPLTTCHLIVWNHDESIYYANDQRKIWWVHKNETAMPYAKGEGPFMMITNMISPDYGSLQSPDGAKQARVVFQAGKNRKGYFTSNDIIKQASAAMDIFNQHYSDEDHIFIFDNATMHLERADDALSARHMPKFPPKCRKEWDGTNWGGGQNPKNWGVEMNVIGPDGKPVHGPNGVVLKQKVWMCNRQFADGSAQSLYYPEGYGLAGVFKGMGVILEEHGFDRATKICAECPKFQCE
jgi:hypothetical protein